MFCSCDVYTTDWEIFAFCLWQSFSCLTLLTYLVENQLLLCLSLGELDLNPSNMSGYPNIHIHYNFLTHWVCDLSDISYSYTKLYFINIIKFVGKIIIMILTPIVPGGLVPDGTTEPVNCILIFHMIYLNNASCTSQIMCLGSPESGVGHNQSGQFSGILDLLRAPIRKEDWVLHKIMCKIR